MFSCYPPPSCRVRSAPEPGVLAAFDLERVNWFLVCPAPQRGGPLLLCKGHRWREHWAQGQVRASPKALSGAQAPWEWNKDIFFKAAPSPTVKHLGTFFPEGIQSYNSRPQFCTANSLWLSGFSLVLQRYFFLQLCMPRIMLFYRISELMICEYFIIKYLKQSEYYGETHYQTHQVRLIFFFIFTLDFFPPRIKTYRSS